MQVSSDTFINVPSITYNYSKRSISLNECSLNGNLISCHLFDKKKSDSGMSLNIDLNCYRYMERLDKS